VRAAPVPCLEGTYIELRHMPTGARHVHIANDDRELGFGLIIPTWPVDDTGVAHVLEHLVGCGSARYPVSNAFYAMMSRSLQTYLNGLTFPDYTLYAFATRDRNDFMNLLDVHVDGVFFPLLDRELFGREAHERGSVGVVESEIAGLMRLPAKLLELAVARGLYPLGPYGYNYAGDVDALRALTWAQTVGFYNRHYHPSTASFFTYGSIDLERVLQRIHVAALERSAQQSVTPPEAELPAASGPRCYRLEQTASEGPDGHQVVVAWATADVRESEAVAEMRLLRNVLLSPSSPLVSALLRSGLGRGLSDWTGIDQNLRRASFAIGLKGIESERAAALEQLVLDRLHDLSFKPDGALDQLELEARDLSVPGAPLPIAVLLRIASTYRHGGDAWRVLDPADFIADMRRRAASKDFLPELTARWLLGNPDRACVVLSSRSADSSGLEATSTVPRSAARVESVRTGSEALPICVVDQVMVLRPKEPVVARTRGAVTVAVAGRASPGVVAIDVRLRGEEFCVELLPFVPVVARGISAHVAGAFRATGAVRISASTEIGYRWMATRPQWMVTLSTSALAADAEALLRAIHEGIERWSDDPATATRVCNSFLQQRSQRLVEGATRLAITLAGSQVSAAVAMEERMVGATAAYELRATTKSHAVERLAASAERLMAAPSRDICLAPDGSGAALTELALQLFGGTRTSEASGQNATRKPRRIQHQARLWSSPVAANAMAFLAPGPDDVGAAALAVLAEYLRIEHLHPEVRDAGGAYGAYAAYEGRRRIFVMASVRDPHVGRTFEAFASAVLQTAEGRVRPRALNEARISALSTALPPVPPLHRAADQFLQACDGYSLARLARHLDAIRRVEDDDVIGVATRWLKQGAAALATVANPQALASAQRSLSCVFNAVPLEDPA
jgi:Zn-dependent M16 (insulinase) family peptidase